MKTKTNEALERVVRMLRERFETPAKTIEEVRQRFEELAVSLPHVQDAEVERVRLGGVPATWITVSGVAASPIVYFLHGGGYNCGSLSVYRDFCARISRAVNSRVLFVDYRLAPEHKFPAAVEDATAAYRALIAEGADPRRVVFLGDSAGGGLVLATLVALRDAGDPLPAAAACISPWVDLEGLGESVKTKADEDPWIGKLRIEASTRLYLGDGDPRQPLAAPLHADLTGLPPLLIQVGTAEVLLDDARRIADRAHAHGVNITLDIWDNMVHVFPFFAGILPEGLEALDDFAEFVRLHVR